MNQQNQERHEVLELEIICIKDSPGHQAIKILLEDVECRGIILHKEHPTGQALSQEKMKLLFDSKQLLLKNQPLED